jgi:hypothetical protein
MPDQHKPQPPHRLRGFWIFVIALLAVNWISVLAFQPSAQPRVKVPFSPYFLTQLQAGKVKSISSRGDTIEGTFATKLRYPPNDTKVAATTLFSTEVPTFWNNAALTTLLRSQGVQVNAQSTSKFDSAWIDWCVGMVTSSSCTRGQRWCSVASRAGRRLAAVLSIEAIRRRPCGSRGCTAWRASAARRRMSSA